jgi:hypothetical protein
VAPYAPRLRSVRSAFPRAARQRIRRSILTSTFAAIAGLAVVLVGPAPVHAAPSVSEIEKQIDEAWNKLEPIIEKHNATRQDLAAKKKQVAALQKKIQPLQLQIDLAMNKVGVFAVQAYKGNMASAVNAILTTGSPTTLADQLTVLDQFARRQQRDVQAVMELKQRYATQNSRRRRRRSTPRSTGCRSCGCRRTARPSASVRCGRRPARRPIPAARPASPSSSPAPRSASRTSGVQPGRTRTTAPA